MKRFRFSQQDCNENFSGRAVRKQELGGKPMRAITLHIMEHFPERLDKLMKTKGLSARKLAKVMTARGYEVSAPTVGAWRRGERYPDLAQAFELTRILGVSLEYLATGSLGAHDEPLTEAERDALKTIRLIGEERAMARLLVLDAPPEPWQVKSVTDLSGQSNPQHKRSKR